LLKLSYLLLKKRKKFVTAIVGVISLSAMLVIFANITADSIYEQKKELALKTYGSFICGVNKITTDDIEKIRSSSDIRAGFWELYENAELGESTFTIGYGDQTFLDMTNAVLEAGRMPEAGNEIAVERFVAEMYGISEPGSNITLSIHNESVPVKVTGILRNYTNQLSVYYRLDKGMNNYPNILCGEENIFYSGEDKVSRSALFGFLDTDRIGINQIETLNAVLMKIDALDLSAQTIYTNDNLFNRGLLYCGNMKIFSAIFSGLVVIATLLCSCGILRIFYREYGEKLGILMSCGLQRGKALCIIAVQLLFFTVSGGIISVLGGVTICNYLGRILYPDIPSAGYVKSFQFLMIWFVLLYLFLLLLFYSVFHSVRAKSILRLLSAKLLFTKKKTDRKCLNYNIVNGIRNPKCSIVLLYIFIFSICYIVLNSYSAVQVNYDGFPDYELFSKELVETETQNGYVVEYNADSFISSKALEKLSRFGEAVFIDAYPNVNSNTLLLKSPQITPYFEKWLSSYALEPTSYEASILKQKCPKEADEWIPVPNVEFIAADADLVQMICQEYSLDTNYEKMQNHAGAILFLPEVKNKEEIGLQAGDRLSLGGIHFSGQDVAFDSMEVSIEGIVTLPYESISDGYLQQRKELTVVVSDGIAETGSIFKGYRRIVVYIKDYVEKQIADEIDNCMNEIQSEIQGGVLYSKRTTQEADALYAVYIHSLGFALAGIILVFSGIFIYTHIFSMLKEQKRKYGILRALGISVDTLAKSIFVSYISSMLLSIVADIIIVVVFFKDVTSLYQKVLFALGSWAVIFILTFFSWILPFFLLKKEKIRQMIERE